VVEVTPTISIDDDELAFEFVRASGPGGQKVNKTSSAAQLRFNVTGSPSLPAFVKQRLVRLAGSRMTGKGVLVIQADRHRTQKANRADALDRLVSLVRQAARRPTKRRPTQPTRASRQRRLDAKKRRGQTKRLRERPDQ